jgi:hypothetical protein
MTRPKKTKRGGARKGAGRPPIDPATALLRRVPVRVTEAEGAILDAWAAREGRPLATLVRERALRAARR